jgi:hypothetical protein
VGSGEHEVERLDPRGRIPIRRHDGTTLSGRQARRRFGIESVTALRALGVDAVPVPRPLLRLSRQPRAERKGLRLAIAPLLKAYQASCFLPDAGPKFGQVARAGFSHQR